MLFCAKDVDPNRSKKENNINLKFFIDLILDDFNDYYNNTTDEKVRLVTFVTYLIDKYHLLIY